MERTTGVVGGAVAMSFVEEFRTPVAKPEWLAEAVPEAEKLMRLIQAGKVPEVIKGWMVVVMCRRLLRCVYGSDLEATAKLREWVLSEVEREQREDLA